METSRTWAESLHAKFAGEVIVESLRELAEHAPEAQLADMVKHCRSVVDRKQQDGVLRLPPPKNEQDQDNQLKNAIRFGIVFDILERKLVGPDYEREFLYEFEKRWYEQESNIRDWAGERMTRQMLER